MLRTLPVRRDKGQNDYGMTNPRKRRLVLLRFVPLHLSFHSVALLLLGRCDLAHRLLRCCLALPTLGCLLNLSPTMVENCLSLCELEFRPLSAKKGSRNLSRETIAPSRFPAGDYPGRSRRLSVRPSLGMRRASNHRPNCRRASQPSRTFDGVSDSLGRSNQSEPSPLLPAERPRSIRRFLDLGR